jgi:elongation factor G
MKYLEGEQLTEEEIEHGLLVGVETGKVVPILLGSAASGIGVATLLDRIIHELPSPVDMPKTFDGKAMKPDASGPLCGFVFKTTADPFVGKINFVRVFSGTLKMDDHVLNVNREKDERVHNLFYPHGKGQEPATVIPAGDICGIAKLQDTHTGDTLCSAKDKIMLPPIEFPEPIYRIAVVPATKADEDKLGTAITRLMEEDPTFRHSRDAVAHQEILEGMGDIHLETVIEKMQGPVWRLLD